MSAWRCMPCQDRPSKWSRPSSSLSCWWACSQTHRLDCTGERLEVDVGRQVGKIVFALARGAMLPDEPGLHARHVLHALLMDALWRTIGDPHAHGGEGGRQGPFGSFTPADASPLCGGENVFSRRGKLIWNMALARPPASGDRKHEPDGARIDFLL